MNFLFCDAWYMNNTSVDFVQRMFDKKEKQNILPSKQNIIAMSVSVVFVCVCVSVGESIEQEEE